MLGCTCLIDSLQHAQSERVTCVRIRFATLCSVAKRAAETRIRRLWASQATDDGVQPRNLVHPDSAACPRCSDLRARRQLLCDALVQSLEERAYGMPRAYEEAVTN